jgi:hypothetical protein
MHLRKYPYSIGKGVWRGSLEHRVIDDHQEDKDQGAADQSGRKCKACTLFPDQRSKLWIYMGETHIYSQTQIPNRFRDYTEIVCLTSSPGNADIFCQ